MSRFDPFKLIGMVKGPEPQEEWEDFMVCPACGQAFDCRNLSEVLHHADEGHEPMGGKCK